MRTIDVHYYQEDGVQEKLVIYVNSPETLRVANVVTKKFPRLVDTLPVHKRIIALQGFFERNPALFAQAKKAVAIIDACRETEARAHALEQEADATQKLADDADKKYRVAKAKVEKKSEPVFKFFDILFSDSRKGRQ